MNLNLAQYVHTLGQQLLQQFGERVHKVCIDAGFTCPNRDGRSGVGGCTFCNNDSFIPGLQQRPSVLAQIDAGAEVVARVSGARKLLAYFQAYTNTYDSIERLRALYDQALAHPQVVGLSVGTRPDCVPDAVLDLLAAYRDRGLLVWLELGLQSSFDNTLQRINRGHDYACYVDAARRARARGLPLCTHLILGLPGEDLSHARTTLERVLEVGTDGLKLHPLHVVKATMLAYQWRHGEYTPLTQEDYVDQVVDLLRRTPRSVVLHRLTGTAPASLLLAPAWCEHKWRVLNAITQRMAALDCRQGDLS